MYILLSSESTVYRIKTKTLDVSQSKPGTFNAELTDKATRALTDAQLEEQKTYAATAAEAAYNSLNPLDWPRQYGADIDLIASDGGSINIEDGSNSVGLGYGLALTFEWRKQLGKDNRIESEVFATGRIHPDGSITIIGHLATKIRTACVQMKKQRKASDDHKPFIIFYPKANQDNVTDELSERVDELGGNLVPVTHLHQALITLLGDRYDGGDAKGRWQPFKGLASFNYEDKGRFFGRKRAVHQLLQSYQDADGLLVVTGVSGSGKSSAVKAGLVPKIESLLARGQQLHWHVTNPKAYDSIEELLSDLFDSLVQAWALDELPGELAKQVLKEPQSLKLGSNTNSPCLWFIDQYEDIFNHSKITREQAQFLTPLLEQLANQVAGLRIIVSIRAEYLETLGRYGVDTHVSQKLNPDEWRAIIEKQATYSGISYEEGFAKRIINDANEIAHALPVVEYLLEQLYLKATTEHEAASELKQLHYDELGGLKGVIANRAEAAINQASHLAHTFFDYFVGQNSEGLPYARSVEIKPIQQKQPELYQLIQAFIENQLVIDCSSQQQSKVKLAHDSLFREWQRLKGWMDENEKYLKFRNKVDGQFAQWSNAIASKDKHAKGYLLKNEELLKQAKLLKSTHDLDNSLLESYVAESIKSRRNSLITRLFIFLIIPGLLVAYFFTEMDNKKEEINAQKKQLEMVKVQFDKQKSINEQNELKVRRLLIEDIADYGLFVEDHIAISYADSVRNVIRDGELSQEQKQKKLDAFDTFQSFTTDTVEILSELSEKKFKFKDSLVRQLPELHKLMLETESMDDEERQYWLDIMPRMTEEQIDRFYKILSVERKKLDALHARYSQEIKRIGEKKLVTEWSELSKEIQLPKDYSSQKLDTFDTFQSNTEASEILFELSEKKFKFKESLVRQLPELHRLILETESMDDEERQYWLDVLPTLTEEQIDRIYEILSVERKKLDATQVRYLQEIKKWNKKYQTELLKLSNGKLSPKDYQTVLLMVDGNPKKAIQFAKTYLLQDSIRDKKLDIQSYRILFDAYRNLQKYEESILYGNKILELPELEQSDKTRVLIGIAELYLKLKQHNRSIDYAKKILEQPELDDKDRNNTAYFLADRFKEVNQLDKAVEVLERLIAHYEDEVAPEKVDATTLSDMLGSLSWYFLLNNQPRKAIEASRKALRMNPSRLWIKTNLAHGYLFSGQTDRAKAIYFHNAQRQVSLNEPIKSFAEVIVADFEIFKEQGVEHSDLTGIEKNLRKLISTQKNTNDE